MNKRPFPSYILSRPSRIFSIFAFLAFFLFASFSFFPQAQAADEPFTYPANWGGTGLMEIPTARIMKKDSIRAGVAQIKPYRFYYGAMSPFKGLEIEGRITELIETDRGSGNQRDKAIDIKYQLIPEGKYLPAFAIGIMDPHGTRLYASQYIAASKQIYPFDMTLGFGNGRFGKEPLTTKTENIQIEMFTNTADWMKESQLFWGIQFAPSEKFALMAEYSPIKYHKQVSGTGAGRFFPEPVSSKFNFGLRYKPTKWSEIDVSYQRGEQIGVNLSVVFDIGKPLIPIYDSPYRETASDILNPVTFRVTKALYMSGFRDIGVLVEDNGVLVEAENDQYFYNVKAIGVVLKILVRILPEHIRDIQIVLKENGIPVIKLSTTRQDTLDLYAEKMNLYEFMLLSDFRTDLKETQLTEFMFRKLFRYGLKPDFQSYLNSREGFFKYRLGGSAWGSFHPWNGASFIAGIEYYPLNTVPLENVDDSSIPVRSDVALYKNEKAALGRLMFDQITKLTPDIYGRISAGLLEVQYAGVDAEVAMPILGGRVFLSLSGSAVKKRDHENPFEMKRDNVKEVYTTAFFTSRLNIPEQDAAVEIRAGRFLAGDNGARITVFKHIKGIILWAWYSFTDTSIFNDNLNEGYHDKVIGISIPIRVFKGSDSKTAYNYSISSWTRDTGQDIEHFNSLFDLMGRNSKIYVDKDKKMLYR